MNKAIAMLLGILIVLPAQAQTLADALEQAWARHPQAAAVSAREDEARARADVAAGITPGPASLSLSSLNDRLNRNRGKQEWEAEMAVPLWLPGQQSARVAEAESTFAEVAARRTALRLQIAGEVREAWWAVADARNARDLARRRATTAGALEADVLRRFKAGDLARIDANLAQGERLAAEAEAIEAEAALLRAEHIYRNLTGAAAPSVLAAEAALAAREPVGPHPQPLSREGRGERSESLRDLPGPDHPQLAAVAAAAQTARAKLRVAEETRRDAPEIALRVVRERGEFAEPYASTVGVKLTIPFSSGARVRQESSAARAEASQADAELALARLRLQLDTEKARLDLAAAERQFAMASVRRELTADNLRLAEKAFSLGESDLTTLLRVRADAFEAEAFLNRQQVARAAAQSRLKQVLGVLP
ncbi:MAG: TolC family protein [Rhodocyclales bacterium]|nr:TolC family protein [Rhodocyclales bacterium]